MKKEVFELKLWASRITRPGALGLVAIHEQHGFASRPRQGLGKPEISSLFLSPNREHITKNNRRVIDSVIKSLFLLGEL
jgi:hypothetical protein